MEQRSLSGASEPSDAGWNRWRWRLKDWYERVDGVGKRTARPLARHEIGPETVDRRSVGSLHGELDVEIGRAAKLKQALRGGNREQADEPVTAPYTWFVRGVPGVDENDARELERTRVPPWRATETDWTERVDLDPETTEAIRAAGQELPDDDRQAAWQVFDDLFPETPVEWEPGVETTAAEAPPTVETTEARAPRPDAPAPEEGPEGDDRLLDGLRRADGLSEDEVADLESAVDDCDGIEGLEELPDADLPLRSELARKGDDLDLAVLLRAKLAIAELTVDGEEGSREGQTEAETPER